MRRIALLGLILSAPLALAGCGIVGDPTDGMGGFIADTHTPFRGPNRPAGDAENMQRVEGGSPIVEPLLFSEGNVWPGPIPHDLTLNELENGPDAMNRPPMNGPIGNGYNGMPHN